MGVENGGLIPCRWVDPKTPVIGFEAQPGSWAGEPALGSLRPIYTRDANGTPNHQRIVAREGFAVSGIEVLRHNYVNAVKPHFRKLRPDGSLDPGDAYQGDWLGFPNQPGDRRTLGDTGARVIGLFTRCGAVVDGVVLVLDR